MNTALKALLIATILALPIGRQLFVWQPEWSATIDHNPYQTFAIHIGEILIWGTFLIASLKSKLKYTAEKEWPLYAMGCSFLMLTMSQTPVSSALNLIHLASAFMLYKLLTSKILSKEHVQYTLLAMLSLQAILGIIQFTIQGSLGLTALGETTLSAQEFGIAKLMTHGKTFIRAYGLFPHANILGGYLMIGLFILKETHPKSLQWIAGTILTAGLVLSGSESALVGLLISLIVFTPKLSKQQKLTVSAFFVGLVAVNQFSQAESLHERIQSAWISIKLFMAHPEGIGLSQFTATMNEFSPTPLKPWELQPVHNSYLLLLNEWGIFPTFLLFTTLLQKWKPLTPTLLALAILALFDHYLVSLYHGWILVAITFAWTKCHHCPKTAPSKSG